MRMLRLIGGVEIAIVAVAFAGCGGGSSSSLNPSTAASSATLATPNEAQRNSSGTYGVIYSFGGTKAGDGNIPAADLIDVKGTLYGTTFEGGTANLGTVFSLTPDGKETVLHTFAGSSDGAYPEASLLYVDGALYGTTEEGGKYSHGTAFSTTLSGTEKVLHVFGARGDGIYPIAGLIDLRGTLYGTAADGGANGSGTVFSITPSGTERVLYSFKGGSTDGEDPHAGLIDIAHTFYGTTYEGGANNDGAVFSITPAGKEKMVQALGTSLSRYPVAGLVNVNGTFYGTTLKGGVNCVTAGGCGTVFAIAPSGAVTVLHSFGGRDGVAPWGGLVNVGGTLYGTTEFGGTLCTEHGGCGTVFSITTSGDENVVHSFGSPGDGGFPEAGLLNVKGTLYGTTSGGGANGFGTVFSLRL